MQASQHSRITGAPVWAAVIAAAVALSTPVGCKKDKKKDADTKAKSAAPVDDMAQPTAMKPTAMKPTGKGVPKVDDEALKKKLRITFGPDRQRALKELSKTLAGSRSTFYGSPEGKALFNQFMQSLALLQQMGKHAQAGQLAQIPPLMTMGYVYALMGTMQLKDYGNALLKQGASLLKKLQFGKAKKLAEQGKALIRLTKVVNLLQKQYSAVLTQLMESKAPFMRLATFAAITQAYPKANEAVRTLMKTVLKDYLGKEQAGDIKTKMTRLLKTAGIDG